MSSIKMFAMLPRRGDMSAQAFHDHWRHPHGTFGARISTVWRYVQSHQVHTDLLGADQSRYEGIVEVWFENPPDALGLPDHPAYREYLVPDEPRFIDMERIRYVFTTEELLASGREPRADATEADLAWDPHRRPFSIKLIQVFGAQAGDWELDDELELGRRIGALRHAVCRPSRRLHPDGASVAGIRELWWPTYTAFDAGVRGDTAAWERLTAVPEDTFTTLVQAERCR